MNQAQELGRTPASDDMSQGDYLLRNWGAWIRSEGNPAPTIYSQNPIRSMFETEHGKDMPRETYNVDLADKTQQIIQKILSEDMTVAVHIYFAMPQTAGVLAASRKEYQKTLNTEITTRGLKRLLDDICVRIGLTKRLLDAGIDFNVKQ